MPVLVAQDNFDRASLGPNWTGVFGTPYINANRFVGSGLHGWSYWNANPFNADQYSKVGAVVETDMAGGGVSVRVSAGASGPNGYTYSTYFDWEYGNDVYLTKSVNGVYSSLGAMPGSQSAGATLYVVGSNLSCWSGSSWQISTKTDATHASGAAGVYSQGAPIDNWEGGDLYRVGWTNEVGTNYQFYNNTSMAWFNYTAPIPVNGNLTKVSWYGSCLGSDGLVMRCAVFEKGATITDCVKVAETALIAYSTNQFTGWHDIPITGNLVQGKTYLVGIATKLTQGSPRIYGNSVTFGDVAKKTALGPDNPWPNSLAGFAGDNLFRPSLYAEYEPAAGGPVEVSTVKAVSIEFLKPITRKSSD